MPTNPALPVAQSNSLVVRSQVTPGQAYPAHKESLRKDFVYSCAYCTMCESEAHAIRFTIDHYEPKSVMPELADDYENLMYCCDTCNALKGSRCPPQKARDEGYRFFRPDRDARSDHFEKSGIRLNSKTKIGSYTIDGVELNRQSLRRLRDLRERLTKCDEFVTNGILALKKFHIDQLPAGIKGSAIRAVRDAEAMSERIKEDIDAVLGDYARSPFIDPDPDVRSRAESLARLRAIEAMLPGQWQAPRKPKPATSSDQETPI
jgi:hypothetical protein